jgi:hypothetical protein
MVAASATLLVPAAVDAQASQVPDTHTISVVAVHEPVIATVWRFRNRQNGFYLWTADPAERADINARLGATWQEEGVAYRIDTADPANDSPLWRFLNKQRGFYLYSADPAERASINSRLSATWAEEGEAYKVTSAPVGTQLWRFRNRQNGTYLYSADPAERVVINNTLSGTWLEEGTAFHVASPDEQPTNPTSEAMTAVRAYSAAFLGGDAMGAWLLRTPEAQSRDSYPEFENIVWVANIIWGDAVMTSLHVTVDGETARATYTYDMSDINQTNQTWVRQGGKWLVDN